MKTTPRALKARDLMVSNPVRIDPDATLQEAAIKMRDADCGVLPVWEDDEIKGIITDRDIAIRAVAKGRDTTRERVSDYMTEDVFSCRENDTLESAIREMYGHKVSRLVVRDEEDELIGILSFGSILKNDISPAEMTKIVCDAACSRAA